MVDSRVKEIAFDFAMFAVALGAICLFYQDNLILTMILLIFSAVALRRWNRKWTTVAFIAAAIAGPISEIVATHSGVWVYSNPSFLNIPLWLPFAWGIFVSTIIKFAEAVTS